MVRVLRTAAAAAALLVWLLPAASAVADADRDREKLEKGEILFTMEVPEEGGLPVFQARAVVDCDRERVWAVINDYENLPNIMPGIVEGRVEKVEGNVVTFYEKDHVPVVEDTWYVLRCVHDDEHFRKTMTMVEGSVKSLEARWALEPFGDGKSLAVYTLRSDPGFYIPRWVQKMSLKRTTAGFMEALRAHACKKAE